MSPRTTLQNERIRKESINKILTAAFKLMASQGYEATSISEIAREAGISKGLMYNYFSSKEQLLQALVDGALAESEKILSGIIAESQKIHYAIYSSGISMSYGTTSSSGA